jgi:SAM-dependent methyltransferase
MVMRSAKSLVRGWKTAGIGLAVLIVIVLEAQGPGAGWPQETGQARVDEEMTKQEKIYRSRGADAPSGYVTDRGLSDYAELLTSDFCDALSRLGSSDRWLDIGAGTGQAIMDYYALDNDAATGKCVHSWSRARAVAMSIEDRRTDTWRQQAAIFGADRIRYLSGKRLRYYSPAELGTFQIITDVYGGFSYTDDLSGFLGRVLSLLDTGGVFYTMVQGVHLESGKDKPDASYQTDLMDRAGRDVKVCSWLKQTTCAKVSCESKSDWDSPTELISIRKVCSQISVPPMKLSKYVAGNPPQREFQIER